MNYTKGQWEASPIHNLSGTLVSYITCKKTSSKYENPTDIARSMMDDTDGSECEVRANAQLIASAPLMYQVLKDAELQIEYLHEKFKETGSGNTILARIRNAINKAEGK